MNSRSDGIAAMIRIGITGPPGAGKSGVAEVFSGFGAQILDADRIAHQLYEPGGPAYGPLVEAFGNGILQADGRVDRQKVRERLGEDPEQLGLLNAAVHPPLVRRLREILEGAREQEGEGMVLDAALIFEWGIEGALDIIVAVDAPRATRMARFESRPGWSRGLVDRMEAAQLPPQQKCRRADYVLHNVGTRQDLREQAETLWHEIHANHADPARPPKP